MIVLGIDPGLANCGFAVVRLTSDSERLVDAGVICTKAQPRKRGVLVGEDNFMRAQSVGRALADLVAKHQPVAVCSEAMSFPQNKTASEKVALSWGVLAAVCTLNDLPCVQPSPQFIKKHMCGARNASKADVEAAVVERYPASSKVLGKVVASRREHAVDAFAVVISSLDGDVIRLIRKVSR